jgi:hypothetical protein
MATIEINNQQLLENISTNATPVSEFVPPKVLSGM